MADIEIEFGYNSEEESIFHSFVQENEKYLSQKSSRSFKVNQESKKIGREVRDILRRVSFFIFGINL